MGDATIVALGGLGLRRARATFRLWFQRALAFGLGGLGLWLMLVAVKPL